MEKLTKRLTVVLIGCIILLLGACAGTGTEEDGDNGDKPVTLYSPHTPEFSEELAEKFKELHGKSVDVHYAGTNVLVNQMIAEKDNPQADVWNGGGGILAFESAIEKDILEPFIPQTAEDWEIVEDGIKLKHEDDYYTGVQVQVLGFAYNTDLVSEEEAPKTWEDLLDPKWEGKIQFPNPAASGTSTLMVMSYMMKHGEEEGWDYFQKLTDQANSVPDSGSAPTTAVSMGEAHIGIGFDFMAYEQKEKGETVDFILPDETPILVNPVALIKDGPNPEGAKEFMEFLLSKDAQEIIANWNLIPIHPEVDSKTPLNLEDVKPHAAELDMDWVNENYDRIRNEWSNRIE